MLKKKKLQINRRQRNLHVIYTNISQKSSQFPYIYINVNQFILRTKLFIIYRLMIIYFSFHAKKYYSNSPVW